MKQGWKKVYLSDISVNLDSKRIPITKGVRIGGVYPYYGASGIVDYVSDYIFDGDLLLISEDGANLLARSTPIAFSVSGKIWVNNHAHILKFESKITQRYIERYFESIKIDDFVTGAAQPKLNQKSLNSIPIIIPKDIPEQERIVGILDGAFAKIGALQANAQQNLQNTKDLFQASLKQELTSKQGWKTKTLSECSTIIGDGIHGTPSYSSDGEYYFINGNNLNTDKIEIKDATKKVHVKEFNKYKVELNENTVFVSINGTLGKTAFYNNEPIILGKSACYINVKEILSKELLRYIFISDMFLFYAHKNATGATIKNLGLKAMRLLPINLPPIIEQSQIVEKLNALSERCRVMEENYRQTIDHCNALKQALLKKAFSGEL